MKVFLVDDEYISNFVNRRLVLNINPAVEAIEFTDSEEAYNMLEYEKPDLIFLDINMPVMNGWDFLDKMKANGLQYEVVILTSSVNTIDHTHSLNYTNITGYVEKPATMANIFPHIMERVNALAVSAAY